MKIILLALAVAFIAASCRAPTDASLVEVQRVRSGELDVVLLSDDGTLTHGKDALTVEFRSASSGDLVDVGSVKGAATMPMAGLPSMMGSVFLERSGTPGRYTVDTDLSMSGGWDVTIEWDGAAGRGRAALAMTID